MREWLSDTRRDRRHAEHKSWRALTLNAVVVPARPFGPSMRLMASRGSKMAVPGIKLLSWCNVNKRQFFWSALVWSVAWLMTRGFAYDSGKNPVYPGTRAKACSIVVSLSSRSSWAFLFSQPLMRAQAQFRSDFCGEMSKCAVELCVKRMLCTKTMENLV